MIRNKPRSVQNARLSRLVLASACAVAVGSLGARAAIVDEHWLSATSANWSVPARWDGGVVPNNAADTYRAFIDAVGTYTVTLDINPTVDNFTLNATGATFSASSRIFAVNGATSLLAGTTIWSSSTWNGAGLVTNSAIFLAQGGLTINSAFANAGSLTIRSTAAGTSSLSVGSSFTNTGLILLRNEDGGNSRDATLTQSSGVFQNNSGGVLTTEQGPGAAGSTRVLTIATLQNAAGATVNINFTTAFNASNGQFNNSGALNIGTGRQLTLQNAADITQSAGTITIADGASIFLNNASSSCIQTGGALVISGTGFLQGDGATITFNGGSINTSASTRTLDQIIVNSANLNFGNTTPVTGSAAFYLFGNSNLSGNIPTGMTIRVASNPSANTVVNAADNLTNNGTLRLANDDPNNNRNATFTMAAGKTLTNNGLIELIPGTGANSGVSRILNVDLINNGTVNVSSASVTPRAGGLITNNSSFNITSTYALQSGAGFTQVAGTLAVGNGANSSYLYLNNPAAVYTQTGGALVLTGAGFLQNDPGATYIFNGGSINTSASTRTVDHIIVNSGNLNFGNATPITGSAAFYLFGTGNLAGNIPTGMTVRVASNPSATTVISAANDFINNGILRLANDDASNNRNATFAMATGKTLTNNGLIELIPGTGANSGVSRILNVDLVNNGTVNVSFASITSRTGGLITNNSSFNITAPYALQGTISFLQTAGTLAVGNGTNSAYLYLNSAAAVYTQTGGTLLLTGAGFLQSDPGSTFNFTSGVINTAASTRTTDHIIVNSANLNFGNTTPVTGSAAFYLFGNSNLSGNIPTGMTIRVASNPSANTVVNAADNLTNNGTLRLANDDPNNNRNATFTMAAGKTLTNNGLIELIPGTGANSGVSRILNVDLINNGTVNVSSASVTPRAGGLITNNSSFNITSTYALQSGAGFTQVAGTLAVGNGANSSYLYLNNPAAVYTQTGGALVLTGAGFLQNDPGATYIFNGGSINTSASTRTVDHIIVNSGNLNFGNATPITGSAAFYLFGTGNLAGNIPTGMTVRVASNPSATTVISAANDFINNGILRLANDDASNNRNATFAMATGKTLTNNGLIELIPGTGANSGVSRILNVDLVNNGTVNVSFASITSRTGGLITNNSSFNITAPYALQGTISFLQTAGTLAVGNGTNSAYLYLNSAAAVYTQTGGTLLLTGAGFLQSDPGSTFNFTSGVINTAASTRTTDHIIVNSANLNFGNTTPVTGSAAFYLFGNSNLSGNIPTGMTIRVASNPSANTVVNAADNLTNNGTLRLANDDPNNNRNATFTMAAGKTLTNNGLIELIPGTGANSGVSRILTAIIDNRGTFNVNFANTIGRAGAAHVNSGTFAILNGNSANLLGTSFTNQPAGIVKGVGSLNLATNSVSFTNQGTVKSEDLGTLSIVNPANVTNLSGAATSSTLTGGIWQAFAASTLTLSGISINTNAADVTLSGTGSQFVAINSLATNNGAFHVLANRNFFAAASLTNNGWLQLGGGSLSASTLTNNSSGSLTGFGIVAVRPINHGLVESSGGTFSFANGINGASGAIQVDTGSVMNLSNGTAGSSADSLLIQSGGSLNLGTNSLLLKVSYANAGFGSGNSFNKHANVTASTGQILADGDNTQTLSGAVTNGSSATPTINIGTVHIGDSISSIQVNNTGTHGPGVLYAVQTSVNGGTAGPFLSAANVGPVAIGASAPIVFTANATGSLAGLAVHIANNFDNIPEQTASMTGIIQDYAIASLSKDSGSGTFTLNDPTHATLDLGIINPGQTTSTSLSILNLATGAADTLAGSWTLNATSFGFTNFSPFTNIAAGSPLGNLLVNFTLSTPGFITQTATLHPLSQNNAPFSGTLSDFTLTLKIAVNPLPAIWDGSVGNWTSSAKWSITPLFPVNDNPTGALYAVIITAGTVSLDTNPAIRSVQLANATFTGTLDINTHKLTIQSATPNEKASKLSGLIAAINSGSNGNTWTGKGITSSTAANDPQHYAVGLFDNAVLGLATFGSTASTDANALLIAVAHQGDANLSGIIDIQDQSLVTNHWQSAQTNWAAGDLNLDGFVDLQDLTLVTNNWQQSSAFPLAPDPQPLAPSPIPEPLSLLLLSAVFPFFPRPRRQRRT